ncbi:MAG: zinc ribbon domain-containing protein [Thermoleophilia bacterium]
MTVFCPACGKEPADSNSRFCIFCGSGLPTGEAVAATDETAVIPSPDDTVAANAMAADDTIRMSAAGAANGTPEAPVPADTAVIPPQEPPPPTPPSPGPPGRSYPWKFILPIAAAGIILAGSAGAGVAYFTKSDDNTSSKSTKSSTKSDSDKDRSTRTRTSKTDKTSPTGTTRTSRTTTDSDTRAYVTAMDQLIAENYQLEQQIGVLADEINRVAPAGINDALLSEIDTLGIQFLGINTEAQDLDVPTAFRQTQQDFLQLTSYNMDRCNALYAGAIFWQSGQPYQSYFEEGRQAKESYLELYPVFEDEYAAAQAPLS